MNQPRSTPLFVRGAPVLLTLVVVIAAGGCGGDANGHGANGSGDREREGQEEPAITVRAGLISREPISSLYSTSATLRADRRATVIARTRGVVRRLAVEEGDRVVVGQALAFLEDDEQKIAAARAHTTEETARRDHERLSGLYDQGLVSVDEYETSRRDSEDAAHAFELAELELSRTVIRAPIAGVVVTRHLDVGATVSDGTPVYDLADLDPLYADINIPERHVTRLAPGQEVRLTADATGAQARAIIERIAPAVDPATGTVKVTVAVVGDSGLRPGAFVRVDIVTDTHADSLVVSRSALVAEGRRWNLFRVSDDGTTVDQIEVELGFETGERVEITGSKDDDVELADGDQVIVVGAPALSDGAKIRLMTEDQSASENVKQAS
ncbi:MAG: efflux RND transporter periplasmic adaptor subunit [Acidobacteriota bacterium]